MVYVYYGLAGVFAGLCAGLFGVGGGLIIVPILVYLFALQGMNPEVVAHVALGTSLATIALTSISSMSAHNKRGNVRWDMVRQMALWLMLGSCLGAWTAKQIRSDSLQTIIGIGAMAMAAKMLFFPNKERSGALPPPSLQKGAAFGIGSLSAIFGIGGGSLTVPFLTYCGLPMQKAVGTSAACGLPIALAGAAGFLLFGEATKTGVAGTIGFVHAGAFLCISVASFLCAKVGAAIAHRLPASTLKRAFACLLFFVGLKMAIS